MIRILINLFLLYSFNIQAQVALLVPEVKCTTTDNSQVVRINKTYLTEKTTAILGLISDLETDVTISRDSKEYAFSGSQNREYETYSKRGTSSENLNVTISTETGIGKGFWVRSVHGYQFTYPFSYELECKMEIPTRQTSTKESLFLQAACDGNLDVLRIYQYLPNLDFNYFGQEGDNPLLCAARNAKDEVVRFLLDLVNVDKTAISKNDGKSLIQLVRASDIIERLYVELLPNQILHKDFQGNTIFHYNWSLDRYQNVLSKLSKNQIFQLNNNGNLPLKTATGEWFAWLIEHSEGIELDDSYIEVFQNQLTSGPGEFHNFPLAERILHARPQDAKKVFNCKSNATLDGFLKASNTEWIKKFSQYCEVKSYKDLLKEDGYSGFNTVESTLLLKSGIITKSYCVYKLLEFHDSYDYDYGESSYFDKLKKLKVSLDQIVKQDRGCDNIYQALLTPIKSSPSKSGYLSNNTCTHYVRNDSSGNGYCNINDWFYTRKNPMSSDDVLSGRSDKVLVKIPGVDYYIKDTGIYKLEAPENLVKIGELKGDQEYNSIGYALFSKPGLESSPHLFRYQQKFERKGDFQVVYQEYDRTREDYGNVSEVKIEELKWVNDQIVVSRAVVIKNTELGYLGEQFVYWGELDGLKLSFRYDPFSDKIMINHGYDCDYDRRTRCYKYHSFFSSISGENTDSFYYLVPLQANPEKYEYDLGKENRLIFDKGGWNNERVDMTTALDIESIDDFLGEETYILSSKQVGIGSNTLFELLLKLGEGDRLDFYPTIENGRLKLNVAGLFMQF
jgi:hypothetical protein